MQLHNQKNSAPEQPGEDESAKDRIERLKALRRSLTEGDAPARSREEVEQVLRDRLRVSPEAMAAEAEQAEIPPEEPAPALGTEEPQDTFADAAGSPADPGEPVAEPVRPGAEAGLPPLEGAEPAPEFEAAAPLPEPLTDGGAEPGEDAAADVSGANSAAEDRDDTPQDTEFAPESETAPSPLDTAALISKLRLRAVSEPPAAAPVRPPTPDMPDETSQSARPEVPEPAEGERSEAATDTFAGAETEPAGRAEPAETESEGYAGPVSVPSLDDPDLAASLTARAAMQSEARAKKTRLLGFDHSKEAADPFAAPTGAAAAGASVRFPVGWIVVTGGPGRGESFVLTGGAAQIGRGEDQAIRLDFGDTSISREKHAAIAYDPSSNSFVLAQGGKANLVRLNDRPVLSNEALAHGDRLRIGETTLRFVALCGEDFSWEETPAGEDG